MLVAPAMSLWIVVGHLGHALAAVLFTSLAILTLRRPERQAEAQLLIVALALTALWSMRHAFLGLSGLGLMSDGLIETARNAAWMAVLAAYRGWFWQRGERVRRGRPLLLMALVLVLLIQLTLDLLVGDGLLATASLLPLLQATWLLRCLFAIGALFVLHGLTGQRDHPASARREAWIGAALAGIWAYDFNHYMLAWLVDGRIAAVGPLRGVVMALLAMMLALGLRSDGARPFALSRPVITRLVSLGIVGLYLIVVAFLVRFSSEISDPLGRIVQFGLLFVLAVAVLAFLPSASLRSWLRVEISKHVFAHRYDYRALWLRFAATADESVEGAVALDARVARAIAEAVDAPAAILYLRGEDGELVRTHLHSWPEDAISPPSFAKAFAERIGPTGWIVDLAVDWGQFGELLPSSLQFSRHAWAIAPLMHREQLIGAIMLAKPPGRQLLDWEDLDVLRVVCGEAAARLSEERNRAALAEAQRFDEFNRRFAFIMHDLKNLVSQMSLLSSNARRHADNPAFRKDMVLTLEETAGRMNELLHRLGRPGSSARVQLGGLLLGPWIRERASGWAAGLGPVEIEGDVGQAVYADVDGLNRALGHLVRNAIEASSAQSIVRICIEEVECGSAIHVVDQGLGMSSAFMRDDLFRPFSSTKQSGFGLGAHEARLLVQAMGGTLSVESVEGQGSRFTIQLPFADMVAMPSKNEPSSPVRKAG